MQNNYRIFNIRDFIKDTSEDVATEIIDSFSSPQNPDVEHFLKANAVDFTKKHQSVTYLVFSQTREFLGYFSLAIKSVEIPLKAFSKTQIKKLQRVSTIDEGTNSMTVAAYLIAQLGKNYSLPKGSRISGAELLNIAYDEILFLQYNVGGVVAFLECEENDFLLGFYTDNNHIEFGERRTDKENSEVLHQLLKFL